MTFPLPKNRDVRQNVNSPEFMTRQPRLAMNYNYNFEEHREFQRAFDKYTKEDKERLLYQEKLIKYIKTYPNRPEVKHSLLKKHVVVPLDSLPDYDVDITGFKPPVAKKSRRKYDKPKYDIDIKDYHCWRSFDRTKPFFTDQQAYLSVELIPKNLVDV
jgi:hypothetical protein